MSDKIRRFLTPIKIDVGYVILKIPGEKFKIKWAYRQITVLNIPIIRWIISAVQVLKIDNDDKKDA